MITNGLRILPIELESGEVVNVKIGKEYDYYNRLILFETDSQGNKKWIKQYGGYNTPPKPTSLFR